MTIVLYTGDYDFITELTYFLQKISLQDLNFVNYAPIPTSPLLYHDFANLQTANDLTNVHAFILLSEWGHKFKVVADGEVIDVFTK